MPYVTTSTGYRRCVSILSTVQFTSVYINSFIRLKTIYVKGGMNIHFIQDEPDRCVSNLSFYSIVRMSNRGKIFHDQNWREHFEPEEEMKTTESDTK